LMDPPLALGSMMAPVKALRWYATVEER
jgi:hypothetical protein